jgi:hypothetical protein
LRFDPHIGPMEQCMSYPQTVRKVRRISGEFSLVTR